MASSRRLAILLTTSAQAAKALGTLDAIIQGLKEHGWIEGQNFTFEYRFADGKMDALLRLAAELVRLQVDAIVTDSTPAIQALKNATQTVPIVAICNDPVASGFASSLGRPGGNITGISLLSADLTGISLSFLCVSEEQGTLHIERPSLKTSSATCRGFAAILARRRKQDA